MLRAFQRYGLVLSSRGGNWYLQGISDPGWPDAVIDELRSIPGDSFEVVDTAPLIVNVNSGQAVQLASGPAAPTNLAGTPGSGQATFTFIPVSGASPPVELYRHLRSRWIERIGPRIADHGERFHQWRLLMRGACGERERPRGRFERGHGDVRFRACRRRRLPAGWNSLGLVPACRLECCLERGERRGFRRRGA